MARFYLIRDIVGLDVKLGLRLMRKSWGLTLVGGVAMALTIGLGTAIFTIWNTATTTTLFSTGAHAAANNAKAKPPWPDLNNSTEAATDTPAVSTCMHVTNNERAASARPLHEP